MFEIFEELRKERGLKYSEVARGAGIPGSTITDWKAGRYVPKRDKLEKIADFFGVPVEYLMTGEMPRYYTNTETAEIAQEIFESKEMRALFSAARDASREDLLTTYQMLLALKKKENRRDD